MPIGMGRREEVNKSSATVKEESFASRSAACFSENKKKINFSLFFLVDSVCALI